MPLASVGQRASGVFADAGVTYRLRKYGKQPARGRLTCTIRYEGKRLDGPRGGAGDVGKLRTTQGTHKVGVPISAAIVNRSEYPFKEAYRAEGMSAVGIVDGIRFGAVVALACVHQRLM